MPKYLLFILFMLMALNPGCYKQDTACKTDTIVLSQEQNDMLKASVQPAVDSLIETGEFYPTLYVHNGKQITFFTLIVEQIEDLHTMARETIHDKSPNAVAYVLLYASNVDTGDGPKDALVIETGDEEEKQAHKLASFYTNQKNDTETDLIRLGNTENLLTVAK